MKFRLNEIHPGRGSFELIIRDDKDRYQAIVLNELSVKSEIAEQLRMLADNIERDPKFITN